MLRKSVAEHLVKFTKVKFHYITIIKIGVNTQTGEDVAIKLVSNLKSIIRLHC